MVRSAVMVNRHAPPCAIVNGVYDPDPIVAANAVRSLFRLLKEGSPLGGVFLFDIKKVLTELLARALKRSEEDGEWYFRATLAEVCPDAETLQQLFALHEWNVMLCLANNKHTPEDILEQLAALGLPKKKDAAQMNAKEELPSEVEDEEQQEEMTGINGATPKWAPVRDAAAENLKRRSP